MSHPPAAPPPRSHAPGHGLRQPSPRLGPLRTRPGLGSPTLRQPAFETPGQPSLSLPPLVRLSSTPPTPASDRRPAHSLGVHSMLNPQADLQEQQRKRRRSGSLRESISPVDMLAPQGLPPISRPTSVDSTQGDAGPQRPFHAPAARLPSSRNMPHARSPVMHRTASLSVLHPPTGTIDAQQSPFLTISGGSAAYDGAPPHPPLPTPPTANRITYFTSASPSAPTPPPPTALRPAQELRRQSLSFPQSGSASPIGNYSPYSQPASVASSHFESSSQQGSLSQALDNGHRIPLSVEDGGRISVANSSQSSIQIMTIKSQQGHHVQIPVEVQAASKVADEKRKRNAGASARFRARRKEKEREASQSISRLETQLRDALEDAEFYRNERDYFRSIAAQQPGTERHFTRPSSPRLRRQSLGPSSAPSSTRAGSAGSPYTTYDDEPAEPERNVRRRINSYHPPHGPGMAASAPGGYHASGSTPTQTPDMPSNHTEVYQSTEQRPVLRDPFAPARPAPYGDRAWATTPSHAHDSRG